MEPCPNHYRPLSEYPVSGNDREQQGKEGINQGPFLVSGRTSGQWTVKTEILKRSIYEVNVYQSELTLKVHSVPKS